jgi:hypothetical protein
MEKDPKNAKKNQEEELEQEDLEKVTGGMTKAELIEAVSKTKDVPEGLSKK